jgi:hypothetical protein
MRCFSLELTDNLLNNSEAEDRFILPGVSSEARTLVVVHCYREYQPNPPNSIAPMLDNAVTGKEFGKFSAYIGHLEAVKQCIFEWAQTWTRRRRVCSRAQAASECLVLFLAASREA